MDAEKSAQWTELLNNVHRWRSNNLIPNISESDLAPPHDYLVRNQNSGNATIGGTWKRAQSALEDRGRGV